MRKKCAPARGFPLQHGAKPVGSDRDKHKSAFASKVSGGGFDDLRGRGEMDETIREIHRRADRFARPAEGIPFVAAEDLQDQHGKEMPFAFARVNAPTSYR